MRQGAALLKHKKIIFRTTCTYLTVASEQENAFFTLKPNLSNVIVTNPVLGKNVEHLLLTR